MHHSERSNRKKHCRSSNILASWLDLVENGTHFSTERPQVPRPRLWKLQLLLQHNEAPNHMFWGAFPRSIANLGGLTRGGYCAGPFGQSAGNIWSGPWLQGTNTPRPIPPSVCQVVTLFKEKLSQELLIHQSLLKNPNHPRGKSRSSF